MRTSRRGLQQVVKVANAVKVLFLIISALFPIVDPLSGSPIFLALTGGDQADCATRKAIQPQEFFRRAFYPLTLPLTVGPGSISVAITLGANATHRYGVHILMILAAVFGTAVIGFSVFLCYGFADRLARVTRP